MKLIDKDAVVSWVTEKREAALYRQHNLERIGQETYVNQMIADNLGRMLSFLDTLEVKEVQEPTASDRGMAEEIIVNLKRVENDYRIDLTKQMEWLRNIVKKGK